VYYPLKRMTRQVAWNGERELYPCGGWTYQNSAIAEAACVTKCVVAAGVAVAVAGQKGLRAGLGFPVFPCARRVSSFFDICEMNGKYRELLKIIGMRETECR